MDYRYNAKATVTPRIFTAIRQGELIKEVCVDVEEKMTKDWALGTSKDRAWGKEEEPTEAFGQGGP